MLTFQSHAKGGQLQRDFRAIAEDLHCNALQLYGTDVGRLEECADLALRHDFHLWIQPRLIDATLEDTLEHLADTARMAERIRKRSGRPVTLDAAERRTTLPSHSNSSSST